MSLLYPKRIKGTGNAEACNIIIFFSAMFMVIPCPVIHGGVIPLKARMEQYKRKQVLLNYCHGLNDA